VVRRRSEEEEVEKLEVSNRLRQVSLVLLEQVEDTFEGVMERGKDFVGG
jgi:hypothetical protein